MALSEYEQRLLDQLEQQLHADDPKFAHSMESGSRRSASTRRIVLGVLIGIAGILVLLAGVSSELIIVGVAGFLVMGAGVYFATLKSSNRGSGSAGKQAGNTSPKGGFMSSLEDKWDQRKKEQ
jgi:heme O synthase-like polyprenyltransferase